jgi:hypothetical protein
MLFAVIGIDYKSKLLVSKVEATPIYMSGNLVDFHLIEDHDEKHGVLKWIFRQDGALSHPAKATTDWIEENCKLLAQWPVNSPDLNGIELLWAILKSIISKLKPSSIGELKQVLLNAWNSIPQSTIDRLCESFGTRLQFYLESDGESISKHLWRCCNRQALLAWECTHPLPLPWMP